MTQLEGALQDILGYFPQYMRPPYFSYNEGTLQTLGSMGYHVIQCDIDSQDWQNTSPDLVGNSLSIYADGLNSGGSLSLMHDIHQTTVQDLVPRVLNLLRERGLKCEYYDYFYIKKQNGGPLRLGLRGNANSSVAVPVGECLGDDPSNWYRAGR